MLGKCRFKRVDEFVAKVFLSGNRLQMLLPMGPQMEAAALFATCFIGTLFVPGSPEAAALLYAGKLDWHPVAVGLVGAAGQTACYAVLYVGGDQLLGRWKFLQRQVERMRSRFKARLERSYLVMTALAGSVGVPPAVGIAALASSMKVGFLTVMSVLYFARVVRISIVAAFGHELNVWWQAF